MFKDQVRFSAAEVAAAAAAAAAGWTMAMMVPAPPPFGNDDCHPPSRHPVSNSHPPLLGAALETGEFLNKKSPKMFFHLKVVGIECRMNSVF